MKAIIVVQVSHCKSLEYPVNSSSVLHKSTQIGAVLKKIAKTTQKAITFQVQEQK